MPLNTIAGMFVAETIDGVLDNKGTRVKPASHIIIPRKFCLASMKDKFSIINNGKVEFYEIKSTPRSKIIVIHKVIT